MGSGAATAQASAAARSVAAAAAAVNGSDAAQCRAPAAAAAAAPAAAAAGAPLALPPVVSRVHARVGLLGNPSDGFYGKTISLSLENFYAEVTLTPRPPGSGIEFVPHPHHDTTRFSGLGELAARVSAEGYYGGVRLLMAACKRFHEHCATSGRALPPGRDDFALSYATTIPRQAGLSGSSALALGALNVLFAHYNVPWSSVPLPQRPNLVLSVENELGIAAGLQDRVIQVYGGLVYMDFDRAAMDRDGHGRYEPLDAGLLPPLWLIYADNPSDSGRVHSDVKRRWHDGDAAVHAGMLDVAACAEEGRAALLAGDIAKLAALMDRNFDLRRAMFGDAALGEVNLRMVAAARSAGAAAKFTGSGGAAVALCPLGAEQEARLKAACAAEGFTAVPIRVAPPCDAQG